MLLEFPSPALLAAPNEIADYDSDRCIYVIDDEIQIRRSLHFVLSTAGITSWPFASAVDFLDNLPDLEPAPILIDVRLPNINGIELMEILLDRGIDWPIIVMTAHADIPIAVQALRLGAIEFLEKPFDSNLMNESVQLAFAQLKKVKHAKDIQRHARLLFDTLSPREVEVICALIGGVSNKAVAYQLSLSVRTVEMHRANALLKLKVKKIAELVQLAHEARVDVIARSKCNSTGRYYADDANVSIKSVA